MASFKSKLLKKLESQGTQFVNMCIFNTMNFRENYWEDLLEKHLYRSFPQFSSTKDFEFALRKETWKEVISKSTSNSRVFIAKIDCKLDIIQLKDVNDDMVFYLEPVSSNGKEYELVTYNTIIIGKTYKLNRVFIFTESRNDLWIVVGLKPGFLRKLSKKKLTISDDLKNKLIRKKEALKLGFHWAKIKN